MKSYVNIVRKLCLWNGPLLCVYIVCKVLPDNYMVWLLLYCWFIAYTALTQTCGWLSALKCKGLIELNYKVLQEIAYNHLDCFCFFACFELMRNERAIILKINYIFLFLLVLNYIAEITKAVNILMKWQPLVTVQTFKIRFILKYLVFIYTVSCDVSWLA